MNIHTHNHQSNKDNNKTRDSILLSLNPMGKTHRTQITKNYENVSSEGLALTLLVSCRIADISNGGTLSKLISYKINRNVHNFHGIYLFVYLSKSRGHQM